MARAHGDPDATLRLIGKPATDSYVAALHRYVADLGLAGAVAFAGHASDAAVASAYAGADVLVVTSEHEGFCVPVVEAMAPGVPVVAFDQGAVPEVLGGAGVLVSDKDPYALAAAVAALLQRRPPPRRPDRGGTPADGRARSRFGRRPLRGAAGPTGRARRHAVVRGIHQFVPMLHRADAVGRHTLRLRDVLAARGVPSHVYVEMDDPETASETRPFARYAEEAEAGDVLVYQFATASAIGPWLGARTEALVVNYHNVTPPEYYAPWDNGMARHQLLAQTQLRELAPRAALGLAVSAFNEAELRQAGFRRTAVVPPAAAAPTDEHAGAAAAGRATDPAGSGARWISVGRLAPNKAIELAVMALLVARAHSDPAATLQVVGRPVVPSYTSALHRFVDDMGLHDAVVFRGALSDEGLAAAVADADVFVLTSRHEGFGVPVIESMALGVPVVANEAGALPEVVGDGGLLVDATDPYAVAEAVAAPAGRRGASRRSWPRPRQRRVDALDLASAGDRAVDLVAALSARSSSAQPSCSAGADGLLHQRDEAAGGGAEVEARRPAPARRPPGPRAARGPAAHARRRRRTAPPTCRAAPARRPRPSRAPR